MHSLIGYIQFLLVLSFGNELPDMSQYWTVQSPAEQVISIEKTNQSRPSLGSQHSGQVQNAQKLIAVTLLRRNEMRVPVSYVLNPRFYLHVNLFRKPESIALLKKLYLLFGRLQLED